MSLNFVKWKLQQQLNSHYKQDQNIEEQFAKFRECIEILDKLGADNCIDPDEFAFDDLDDQMFANLDAKDILDLFSDKMAVSDQDSDSPITPLLEFNQLELFSGVNLLSDDYKIEDLQFMDFETQMQLYE